MSRNNQRIKRKPVNKRVLTLDRRRRNPRNRRNGKSTMGPYSVPQVKTNPIFNRVIRYSNIDNGTTFLYTTADLFYMMGFATSTTAGFSLMSAVRLRRIRWTITPNSDDDGGNGTFTWLGQFSPNNEITIAFAPGVITSQNFYPPQDSVPDWWITDTTSAQDLFQISVMTLPVQMSLDIEIEFTLPHDTTATPALTFTAGTANRIVYVAIPRVGATSMYPVGLPTAT